MQWCRWRWSWRKKQRSQKRKPRPSLWQRQFGRIWKASAPQYEKGWQQQRKRQKRWLETVFPRRSTETERLWTWFLRGGMGKKKTEKEIKIRYKSIDSRWLSTDSKCGSPITILIISIIVYLTSAFLLVINSLCNSCITVFRSCSFCIFKNCKRGKLKP